MRVDEVQREEAGAAGLFGLEEAGGGGHAVLEDFGEGGEAVGAEGDAAVGVGGGSCGRGQWRSCILASGRKRSGRCRVGARCEWRLFVCGK